MIIDEQFDISAPRDEVVAYLLDVERMSQCVSGLENVRVKDDETYEATLRVAVGPIKGVFNGTAELERSGIPDQLKGRASGRDRQSASRVNVDFIADFLEVEADRTRVSIHADVTLRGRLGQFGTGVIQATATELLRDFSSCVDSTLGTHGAAGVASGEATDAGAARPSKDSGLRVVSLLARAAVHAVTAFWRRLRDRLRGGRGAEGGGP